MHAEFDKGYLIVNTCARDGWPMIYFPPFWLDVEAGQLWRDGSRIAMSPKAAAVLSVLVSRPGALFSKQELLQHVWHGADVQASVLKVYVRELRKCLGDNAQRPRYIETLGGRGYRFIADVVDGDGDCVQSAFVGRANELAVLRNALQLARSGYRRAVFVGGRPGIGKSSLCDALLSELKPADSVIARGHCFEAFTVVEPCYAIIDALTQMCREHDDVLGHVIRHAPGWLAALPQYGGMDGRLGSGHGMPSNLRLLAELKELIRAITLDRTLVLVFEDLQWADDATLGMIEKVAQDHEPASLLIVGTCRTGATSSSESLVRKLADIRNEPSAVVLDLAELTREDVQAYLNARFGSRVVVAKLTSLLFSFTTGHPRYIVTALDQLIADGLLRHQNGRWFLTASMSHVHRTIDETLQTTIARRFRKFPQQARVLLHSAAHIGPRFNARLAARVAELDLVAVEEECDRLIREGILERDRNEHLPDGTRSAGYRFRRSIDRTALRRQTRPAAAARLRRRVAEALGNVS